MIQLDDRPRPVITGTHARAASAAIRTVHGFQCRLHRVRPRSTLALGLDRGDDSLADRVLVRLLHRSALVTNGIMTQLPAPHPLSGNETRTAP